MSFLLIFLAALSFYTSREYIEQSMRMPVEVLGAILLTVGFLKMRIWPWSLGYIDVSPSGLLFFNSALGTWKVSWWEFPSIGLGKRKVRFEGYKNPSGPGQTLQRQAVSISKWDLGGEEFKALKLYLRKCFPGAILGGPEADLYDIL